MKKINWYTLSKQSSLDPFWWDNFYEHLSKTAELMFNEIGMKLIPTRLGKIFYSGIDGRKIFFGFCVTYKNEKYNCGVNMEFDFKYGHDLPNGILGWSDSNLVEMKTRQNNINLIKGSWYVISVIEQDHSLVGRGFFLPQNAKPNIIMTSIKNSILQDGNDNDDDQEDVIEPPPYSPNARKIPSLVGR